MSDATPPAGFGRPDLTAFARLDGLGLSVTGQRLEPDRAVLACRVVEPDQWCRRCGSEGAARDTVIRRLAHEPLGWRPTVLDVVVRRYRCADCGHVWRQDTSAAAEPRAKLSRTGLRWALEGIVVAHLTVVPVRDGAGPARLLDMVEGRSKAAFKTWLADRDDAFRDAVAVVAMDGFTGFKTAAAEEIPDAVTVMDPFHVLRLAGDALDRCRRRVQLAIHGHRGFRDDPLYKSRRTLHTGSDLLTDKQSDRLRGLLVDDAHVEVEATWGVYQRMIAAYRHEDRQRGRELMEKLITDLSAGVPKVLTELTTLGRTLKKRAADVLAYFERPGTSNGPTEALNGRLEHLRGSALGFRNLTNYIARSLLETGGFRPQLLHPRLG